jgi:hypothetical protein
MRPRCCVPAAVSAGAAGGETLGAGADGAGSGDGACAGSGTRWTCAQPKIIAQASMATEYDIARIGVRMLDGRAWGL